MKQYQSFIFESYAFDQGTGKITLHYSLDGELHFRETVTVPPVPEVEHGPGTALDHALFALHLIGGVSYYKTCCPKEIVIKSGLLSAEDAAFWMEIYEQGLGQFFYENEMEPQGLIRFPSTTDAMDNGQWTMDNAEKNQRILVPIGGGKDSLVTVELLRKADIPVTLFRVGNHPIIEAQAEEAELPLFTVKRELSPVLFDLNAQGALNGHVPITAYLSVLSVIVALLHDFGAVVMSSERSASEGNVQYRGREINHQWSKSLAFEQMFQQYLARSVTKDVAYFSLLRPLSELHIAKMFTQFPQYLPLATSCNENWKLLKDDAQKKGNGRATWPRSGSTWCAKCPKCAFVFALLAAFLPMKDVARTFGKNLFDDASLLPLYKELLGLEGFKPFECVGTSDETKAALLLTHQRGDAKGTPVMKLFESEVLPSITDADALVENALTASAEHAIPKEFSKILAGIHP
ncbi:MAG: endonuclease domain-containing protein [Candidatus Peregrinibacteria bacterium]|nr:endonuclease domain-containing protein [Candidatus Peregrinibacteria bacterium]